MLNKNYIDENTYLQNIENRNNNSSTFEFSD